MSMSEFEREKNKENREIGSLSIQRRTPPDDFTEEDLAFAAKLHTLFSPEEENLPPYFVQTLLDVDGQRFEPTEHGFEHKTSACVFRRLKLRRHLFYTRTSPLSALSAGLGDASLHRSFLALIAAFLLVVMLTVAFTGESFAAGVAILLRGTHGSGLLPTQQYPSDVRYPFYNWQDTSVPTTRSISLQETQSQMHFQVYRPDYIPAPLKCSERNAVCHEPFTGDSEVSEYR